MAWALLSLIIYRYRYDLLALAKMNPIYEQKRVTKDEEQKNIQKVQRELRDMENAMTKMKEREESLHKKIEGLREKSKEAISK